MFCIIFSLEDAEEQNCEILRGMSYLKKHWLFFPNTSFSVLSSSVKKDGCTDTELYLAIVYCYRCQKDRIFMIQTIDTDLSNF